jgi:ATP phosphoribosyltransferase regulatory subunit
MSLPRAPLEAPEGTRDLLFDAARRLRACEALVGRLFDEAGFHEVVPPSIERAEVFADVPALRAVDRTGRSLSVRADFTDQVARIASTRLQGCARVGLWYRGAVVRDVPPGRMTPRERLQCGLELVGDGTVEADARMLVLAGRALEALGLGADDVRLSVGSTAYFAAVLEASEVPAHVAAQLRDSVDRKDLATTRRLAGAVGDARAREALLFLVAPQPQADVIRQARALAPGPAAIEAVERLSRAVELARTGLGDRIEVDLGEVRGLGYYTGLVFNAYAAGAPGPVGGGGRYDTLLARFGDARPAVGFSLDLDLVAPLARIGDAPWA